MSVEVFQATPPARSYRFELLPEEAMASALELLEQPLGDDPSEEIDGAVTRGLRNALSFADSQVEERQAALVLLAEVSSLPYPEMEKRLRRHRPFRSTELCQLLFDKCAEEPHHDPARALEFCRLTLVAAERLDASSLPRPIRHDIHAETWAVVAASRRLAGDLKGAATALGEAEKHLKDGSGTLIVRAEILVRKASLCCDLEEFEDGHRVIDQALCILRAGAHDSAIARALVAKARLFLESGKSAEGLPLLADALNLVEDSCDRPLMLAVQHNLAAGLAELGRHDEARHLLTEAMASVKLLTRPLGRLDLRWLEGRRAAGAGQEARAAVALSEALHGFRRRHQRLPASQVAFDLLRLTRSRWNLGRLVELAGPLLHHPRGLRRKRRMVTDRSW